MAVLNSDTLDIATLASMFDLGAVQANSSIATVRKHADLALMYNCKAVFALSGFLPYLLEYREKKNGRFLAGGTVGFPSGGMSTAMKVQEAKSVVALGVDEIDMMINVGYMLSEMYQEVEDEIKAIKDVVGSLPLKVILECHYLRDDQICRAAEMTIRAGAQWVKTGTGWAPTGATLENVALLKKTVGNAVKIKAAGGVRDLETVRKMIDLGVERFGLGGKAEPIIDELAKFNGT